MAEDNKMENPNSEDTLMEKRKKENGANPETQADDWVAKPSPVAAGDEDKDKKDSDK
ncbi:hypothetical protein SK066_13280 [Paenibacillus hunanensis]|uniref:hypothetical protein n=1 Tax=Paenibacillus hunanensis TaxID=539262 RepID=UPI002026E6D9|nr:hypothetical protein [Paenibacillus hunanensis]MCL9659947.1 hypothetical protein [Paenibacillus hunanensis]WPP39599.1 hypothetical protein SK066_13280 [Paenibacillus hunanensis]